MQRILNLILTVAFVFSSVLPLRSEDLSSSRFQANSYLAPQFGLHETERIPLDARIKLNADDPFSPAFLPILSNMGAASGEITVPSSKILKLVGGTPTSTYIWDPKDSRNSLGIWERGFIHPKAEVSSLVVQAFTSSVLNGLMNWPRDYFLEAVSDNLEDVKNAHFKTHFIKYVPEVEREKIAHASEAERLLQLRKSYQEALGSIDDLEFSTALSFLSTQDDDFKTLKRKAAEERGEKRLQTLTDALKILNPSFDLDRLINDLIARDFGPVILSGVTDLVVSTSTIDRQLLTPTGSPIQAALIEYGLNPVTATDSGNNVCAGFGFAVDLAMGKLRSLLPKKVAIVVVDVYDKMLNLADHGSAPIFGSQAAFATLEAGKHRSLASLNPKGVEARLFPPGLWTAGELGPFILRDFKRFFSMLGKTVAHFGSLVVKIMLESLDRVGLIPDAFITHQPQYGMIKNLAAGLKLKHVGRLEDDGSLNIVVEETVADTLGETSKKLTKVWIPSLDPKKLKTYIEALKKVKEGELAEDKANALLLERILEGGKLPQMIFWGSENTANGGAASSIVTLIKALSTSAQDGTPILKPEKGKQRTLAMTGFGGGASVFTQIVGLFAPGEKIKFPKEEVQTARAGQKVTFNPDKPVTGAILNHLTHRKGARDYSPVPESLKNSYLIDGLSARGQKWPDTPEGVTPYSYEEVIQLGFGHQGAFKAVELARMPGNQKIHVFTPNKALMEGKQWPKSIEDSLKEVEKKLGKEMADALRTRIVWHPSESLGEWIQSEAAQKTELVYEVAPEDSKVELISTLWKARPDLRVVTNTSARAIVDPEHKKWRGFANLAAEKAFQARADELFGSDEEILNTHQGDRLALNLAQTTKKQYIGKHFDGFVATALTRLVAQHDHSPNTNPFDEITNPALRDVDPRLFASLKSYYQNNEKIMVLVDDSKPMYAGNRMAFGGLVREALRLMAQEGYSPSAIQEAANAGGTWTRAESPYARGLPPIGFNPLEMADDVGLKVTEDILQSYEEYYGCGRRELSNEYYGDFLPRVRNSGGGIYNKPKNKKEAKKLMEAALAGDYRHTPESMSEEDKFELREKLWLALFAEYFRFMEDKTTTHPRWGDVAIKWFSLNLETGGLMTLIDALGLPQVLERLQTLSSTTNRGTPQHLTPPANITTWVSNGESLAQRHGMPPEADIAELNETAYTLSWPEVYEDQIKSGIPFRIKAWVNTLVLRHAGILQSA